jgi:thioredoxin-dependent peroxiredoxin
MVAVGEPAPEFEGTTHDGRSLSMASLRGKPLVLYFYPKASTTGCSIEARGFAEHYPEFQQAGIAVVGVSVDSVEAQQKFSEECHLPFPLIADRDKSIARRYDALGILGMAKRITFLIGPDGRVQDVHQGMLPAPHIDRALAHFRLGSSGAGTAGPTGGLA